jgi:hypothetical protein
LIPVTAATTLKSTAIASQPSQFTSGSSDGARLWPYWEAVVSAGWPQTYASPSTRDSLSSPDHFLMVGSQDDLFHRAPDHARGGMRKLCQQGEWVDGFLRRRA